MAEAEVTWRDFPGGRDRFAEVPALHEFGPRSRPPPGLADWVLEHRVIVGGPSPGPWRHANAPAAVEPMRAFSDRDVEMVTVMSPTQLFKSELAVNAVVYSVAAGRDVLFYEPDLPLLRKFVGDRIRPALLQLEPGLEAHGLDAHLIKRKDSVVELRRPGGGSVLGLTPGQRSGKAAHTAQAVVIDEVEAMASPDLPMVAKARTTTYGADASILAVSVPGEDTAGSVYRLWSQGSRGEYKGRCPRCAEHVSMRWSRVQFDKDVDGFWLPRWEGGEASVVCESCEARWTNAERREAIAAGRYVHQDPDHPHRTFHVPGPAHVWRSVPGIVEVGREAWRGAVEEGDWETYRKFMNEWAGEVWDPDVQGISASKLEHTGYSLRARGATDLGALAPEVRLITVGADVGSHAVYAEWVAWGVDRDPPRVRAWGLRYHQFGGDPDDDLEDGLLLEAFGTALDTWRWRGAGGLHGFGRGLLDIGFRPEVVHPFLRERYLGEARAAGMRRLLKPFGARLLPLMGRATIANRHHPVDLQTAARSKDKRKRLPAPVYVDTGAVKEVVYDTLHQDQRTPEEERAWRWPDNPASEGYGASYRNRLTSEVKVRKRTPRGVVSTVWEIKRGGTHENEPLDCRTYAYAAALVAVYPKPLVDGLLALPPIGGGNDGGGERKIVPMKRRR